MNVFGKNERSWRKARKRGVSPIIATILLVAITVVLAAVLYVLISGLTSGGVGSKPIGSAFTAGNPIASTCTSTSAQTIAAAAITGGCKSGDFIYTLTVESSTVNFGSVLFEVKTAAGTIATSTVSASFAVLNIAQQVCAISVFTATSGFAMSSTWANYGLTTTPTFSSSSPLTGLYTIVIDMGSATATTGTGLTFVTLGTGGYSGTTSLSLP
jgi:flagellin-like protein